MTSNERTAYRRMLPFFCSPPAWVLARVDVPGLSMVRERTDHGGAVLCFLSLLDAMIEVEHAARVGRELRILRASNVEGTLFRDLDGQGLLASLHVAWLASGPKILARPSGVLARFTTDLHEWAGDPVFFEVPPDTLDVFNDTYELAGLFAWRETNQMVQRWDEARLRDAAKRALNTVQVTGGQSEDCNGLALFNPESMEWHFVPPRGQEP